METVTVAELTIFIKQSSIFHCDTVSPDDLLEIFGIDSNAFESFSPYHCAPVILLLAPFKLANCFQVHVNISRERRPRRGERGLMVKLCITPTWRGHAQSCRDTR